MLGLLPTKPPRDKKLTPSSFQFCFPPQIWSYQARNIHSMDHSSGGSGGGRSTGGSNTSTLLSNDSGHATMASPVNHADVLRTKSGGASMLTRPFTVHAAAAAGEPPAYPPPTITTTDFSSEAQVDTPNCSFATPSKATARYRFSAGLIF